MATLNVNGKDLAVDADPSTPILWALRDTLGMTGDVVTMPSRTPIPIILTRPRSSSPAIPRAAIWR